AARASGPDWASAPAASDSNSASLWPVVASHTLIVPASPAESKHLPFGENVTKRADPPAWPLRAMRSRPVATSHSLTVLPALRFIAVASVRLSGEKASPKTRPGWRSAASSLPEAASHILAVLSALPVATVLPSGEKVR